MNVDQNKLNAFMEKLVGDLGATMSSALVIIGDKLGLYKALRASPLTAVELAKRTETSERYVREWANAQAAAGYIKYDAASGRYELPPEHALALADEASPAYFTGAFLLAQAMFSARESIQENFKTGHGKCWGDHHPCLFEGTEKFFRPGYVANLVETWLPALEGVVPKLQAGGSIADVGCGHGISTILLAQAFPKAKVYGFDSHPGSIEVAKKRAQEAGVADRVTFQVAKATDFPGNAYDLVAFFDCYHDLESPGGAAKRVKETLAADGTWMIVEPFASDKAEENHNPVGRVYYSASTMLCVPHSLSQGGPALGAQAGEAKLKEMIKQGGFTRMRRAVQTPFNMILEVRP